MVDASSVSYWWFPQRSAVAVALAIFRAVLTGTFKRLDFVPYTDDAGLPQFRIHVRRTDDGGTVESHEPGINESHPCPPFCPDGG